MLLKTGCGLIVSVPNDDFARLKEVVEGHGAVLLVLGVTELLALCNKGVDDLLGWLGLLKFRLFFRFFLRNDDFAEAL